MGRWCGSGMVAEMVRGWGGGLEEEEEEGMEKRLSPVF